MVSFECFFFPNTLSAFNHFFDERKAMFLLPLSQYKVIWEVIEGLIFYGTPCRLTTYPSLDGMWTQFKWGPHPIQWWMSDESTRCPTKVSPLNISQVILEERCVTSASYDSKTFIFRIKFWDYVSYIFWILDIRYFLFFNFWN